MSTDTMIKTPDQPAPDNFADAYAELQAIAARMKPTQGQIPDVDAIEPLIKRANLLARYCQDRIESVRKLIDDQTAE